VGNREVVPPTQQCAAAYGIIQRIFVSTSSRCIAHAPYSPYVTLRFFLISTTETNTEGNRYADIQAIQTAVTKQLCSIPESSFQNCPKDPQKLWKRCIDAERSYFEGAP
jgi:hypothetical protein